MQYFEESDEDERVETDVRRGMIQVQVSSLSIALHT